MPLAPPVCGPAGDHAGRRPAGGLGGRHAGRPDDSAEHRLRAGGRSAARSRSLRGHHPAGGLRPARQLAPPGHEPRRLHGHPGRGRPRRLRRARGSAAPAVRPGAGRGLRGAVFHLLDLPAGVPRQLPLARRDGGLHHRARRRGVHQPGPEDPRRSPCERRRVGPAGGGGAPQGDPGDLGEHRGLLRGGPGPDPLHSARQPLLGGGRGERLPDRPADETLRAKSPRSAGGVGAPDDPRRGARPPGEGRRRARQRRSPRGSRR